MGKVVMRESTLQKELGRLGKETSLLSCIWKYELAGGAGVLVISVVMGFMGKGWVLSIFAAILMFLGLAHIMRRKEVKADIGRFASGATGEQKVSEILEKQLSDAYMILNDVTVRAGLKKAQNDHIVLGPNGIFVIETKAYAGTLTGNAMDEYLQQEKSFKGKKTTNRIKNPILQNQYHLDIVGERMREGGYVTDDLQSVIVFTNKWSRIHIEGADVPVIKPEFLPSTIQNRQSKYAYDEAYLRRLAIFLAPEAKFEPESAPVA